MTMISSTEKKRICLASPDIHGPKTTDSVGRFCTDLAHLWVKDGHEVTLLYVHDANMDPTPMGPWIARSPFRLLFGKSEPKRQPVPNGTIGCTTRQRENRRLC